MNHAPVSASAGLVTKKLSARMAERYGVEPAQLMDTLKNTAFRVKDHAITDAQMIALLVVADQYGLNPFTKEIYAYPDTKTGGIVPVVGVDGWHRIINRSENFNGIEYSQSEEWVELEGAKPCPEWMEAKIFIIGREKPCIVREYLDECFRKTNYPGPWQTHTKRMLRHKVTIQCSRIAFGFAGIYDEDEAERIVESTEHEVLSSKPRVRMPTAKLPPAVTQPSGVKIDPATVSEPPRNKPEAVKSTMTAKEFSVASMKILEKIAKHGASDQIAAALIKAGYSPDLGKAAPGEFAGIITALHGLIGEVYGA